MPDLFTCPAPAALATAPNPSCPVRFDQIQKFLLRRITGATTLTTGTELGTGALLAASINPLLVAANNTKLLVSPWMLNVVIPGTEPQKEGGNDNTTLNGVPALRGFGFATVTAQMRNVDFSTAQAMRALANESAIVPGFTNLEAWFVNRNKQVIIDNPSTNVLNGFKVYNFAVSDAASEGLRADNIFNVSFDLEPLWSATAKVLSPTEWNPLTISN